MFCTATVSLWNLFLGCLRVRMTPLTPFGFLWAPQVNMAREVVLTMPMDLTLLPNWEFWWTVWRPYPYVIVLELLWATTIRWMGRFILLIVLRKEVKIWFSDLSSCKKKNRQPGSNGRVVDPILLPSIYHDQRHNLNANLGLPKTLALQHHHLQNFFVTVSS